MLFSGGTAAIPKKDVKKEKKSDRDEKYEIQENVFIRWGNSLLANEPLKDYRDLCDIKYISTMTQIVTGIVITLTGFRLDDFALILSALGDSKTNPLELAENQQKAVLGLWWNLVQGFWKKFGPEPIRDEKLTEGIKQWCLEVTRDYEAVSVCDFTSSWRDGHAFNCLLHSFDKKLVNLKKMNESSAMERIEFAFATAEREFRVARLLNVRDLHSEHLDTRSVVCYLMTLYLSLLGKSSISALNTDLSTLGTSATPASSLNHSHESTAQAQPVDRQQTVSVQDTSTGGSETTTPHQEITPQTSVGSEGSHDMPSHSIVPSQITPSNQSSLVHQQSTEGSSPSVQKGSAGVNATIHTSDLAPRTSVHLRKQQQSIEHQSESVEVRSRKSSSSSQKSAKSKRSRKEELTRDFENCLEQVLTWLLEAEEELTLLSDVEHEDLNIVKSQFKDFEQFMISLTDSQDTVGRVLHRGQLLCNKAGSEDERDAIQGQLLVVNSRWEELRALAMDRQTALQTQLNKLQQKQLALIEKWLSSVELEMSSAEPVAASSNDVIRQIEQHMQLQSRISSYQDTINNLSTFVAVVDEGDTSDESIGDLENSLQSVGTRWQTICRWAENRASQLDGLAELCSETNGVFDRLNNWLKEREHDLLGLKSAHHLEDSEEVAEQVRKLQKAEAALEAEHSSFVRLSQLSCELVARLEPDNGMAANDVKRKLDTVTQRWDNLVARIEEHSRTLVRSGKADLKHLKPQEKSTDKTLNIDDSVRADRIIKPDQATSSIQVTTLDAINSETASQNTTDTDVDDINHQLVERFLRHVNKLTSEMEHLQEWTDSFSVSKRPDQVRRMISVCQEKLIEIKDQEAKVNRLQLELEHMHLSADLSSKQLKKANDAFELFAKGWARIVTKISEAMNVLTGHADVGEEAAVSRAIEEWIGGCDRVLSDLSHVAVIERPKRLYKLNQQLHVQISNLNFIEKDVVKKAILKKGLDIIQKRIDSLQSELLSAMTSADSDDINHELDGEWSTVGDIDALDRDLARSQRVVERTRNGKMSSELVEKAETRKAEMEERRRVTAAALEKMKAAEDILNRLTEKMECASRTEDELQTVLNELQSIREHLANGETTRKEAERVAEKMLALDDNVPQKIVTSTRDRIRNIVERWRQLENDIEDHINCVRKEHRRCIQKTISDEERILETLEKTLTASEKASDAEECCEHLDHLENLLDKVNSKDELEGAISSMDESFVRESYARLSDTREKIANRARDRIAALSKAVEECERFEKNMADLQNWAGQMNPLLAMRRATDICALDVPDEYKPAFESGTLAQELSREFNGWSNILSELGIWLNEGDRKTNERLHAQLQHALTTFSDLKERFAEFKQPKSFEEKLERTAHRLADIENTLDDMTGIEASCCSDSLEEAQSLVKKLIILDEDVKSLEKGRDQLMQEGIFDQESSTGVTERIRFSKKKTKELGLRAEGTVERLEDCIVMYKKLVSESEEVENFLTNLELRLDMYSYENKMDDDDMVEQLRTEWNHNEATLRNIEDLERLLRENAVRVNENLSLDRRRRSDGIKQKLDGWIRMVNEINSDEHSLLLEVDELHQYLMKKMDSIEDKQPDEIASSLRFLRGDRDRLSSRARQLAAVNAQLANSNLISDVAQRWAKLEARLKNPEHAALTLTEVTVKSELPFADQVKMLKDMFDHASNSLDFDTAPVSNIKQWLQRVDAVETFLTTSKSALDTVVAEGRRLANSGRMELDTHKAIEQLDEIVDKADQMEGDIDSHRVRLVPLLQQSETLEKDCESMERVIYALTCRNLSDPEIATATRRDLAERDSQLASLSSRAAVIHAALPGKSPASRDIALDSLSKNVSLLESALLAADNIRGMANVTPVRTSPDRTSMSSIGPLAMEVHGNFTDINTEEDEAVKDISIEEDVRKSEGNQETTKTFDAESFVELNLAESIPCAGQPVDREMAINFIPLHIDDNPRNQNFVNRMVTVDYAQPLTTVTMEIDEEEPDRSKILEMASSDQPLKYSFFSGESDGVSRSMEQVFTDLDNIEEAIANDEQFPMENLDDYEERYSLMEASLRDALQKVEESQMTLDMLQVEHTRERVNNMGRDLDERKKRAVEDIKEWQMLHNVLFDAEKCIAMGNKVMDQMLGRKGTPPLEELEERQTAVEELLPRAESLVCDSVRRLSLILPRLHDGGERAIAIRSRVREVEQRFRDLVRVARDERLRLDTRLVDQGQLQQGLENLRFWCDETDIEIKSDVNPLDANTINENIRITGIRIEQFAEKKSALITIEAAKERLIEQDSIDVKIKHDVRRAVSDIAKRIADLRSDLSDRHQELLKLKKDCDLFWECADELMKKANDIQRRITVVTEAVIFTPSPDHIAACRSDASKLQQEVLAIKERIQKANASHPKLAENAEKQIVDIITACRTAIASVDLLKEPQLVDSLTETESQSTVIDVSDAASVNTASIVSSTTTARPENPGDEELANPLYTEQLESVVNLSELCDEEKRIDTRDDIKWQSLTQLRHWLSEQERKAGLTVDLSDPSTIRDMATVVQGVMDHIRLKIMDVITIQDTSVSDIVKQKARELASDMDRMTSQCERRRTELSKMVEDSRQWLSAKSNLELWMEHAEVTIGERSAEESTDIVMRSELSTIENVISELDAQKEAMKDINAKGNAILDTYTKDDAHSLSHQQSKLNMRWTKFNDNVRIRRAVLDASLRSRSDFHSAFNEFEDWLCKIEENIAELMKKTANSQAVKDTFKRRDWAQQQKTISAELDAHNSILRAVDEMGRKLVTGLDAGKEKTDMQARLDRLEHRWRDIKRIDTVIKERLENAELEWEKLITALSTLIDWIENKSKETLAQQPVGGSLSSVMTQGAWVKASEREMEQKGIFVRETIVNAHSYLMQHDLRPKIHRPGVLTYDEDRDSQDIEQRRCGLQIYADSEKLKEKWADLGKQLSEWDRVVQQAAQRLQEMERAVAECQLHLSSVEAEMEKTRPVEQLRLEELKDARHEADLLATHVDSLRVHIDDANDACGQILAADSPLDQHPRNQLDAVNQRYLALKTTMRVRVAALRNALADFGPSSEHFLNQSVALPWQRAISKTNQLPYYIDHTTERTQWEHPVWVEMAKELSQFNRVKFIAYRTAMKLRALQKRLCLDLIDIPMLEKAFNRLTGLSNEESPGLEGMVCCLLPLFEQLHGKHPQLVRSVALAVDLCINFLLNLYDPSRDGILRVLSFKIALVVFSNSQLEEKYRYLFNLVAQETQTDQKHIALLLYDLVHIPRLVGEAAAFGGSNVEPSVRSCFEGVRLSPSISVAPFLEWLKQEPQSIVWLPVMHRLATAEFAKHQAKCNVCKMFPIVGLRYRCLRCFNLDLCQNCFFSQRTAKRHKLKHPMQEYAVPTTSSEDARDFARMVRNKFGRSKNNLGYLPVDMSDEGRPLAAPPVAANNPATDAVHQRTILIAHRLAQLTASQPAEPRDDTIAELKSPAQLISQVDQMQKDELDQVLQRLQLENLELKRELERRKTAASSTPDLDRSMLTSASKRSDGRGATLPRLAAQAHHGRSVPSLKSAQSQSDVMDEARALRLHKQRLEHRSRILEQQNEQLELQLQRLKKVIDQQKENTNRIESWSTERDWMERHSQPPFDTTHSQFESTISERPWEDDKIVGETTTRATRMQSLLATVDDLGRAMESLVVSVVYDSDQEQ